MNDEVGVPVAISHKDLFKRQLPFIARASPTLQPATWRGHLKGYGTRVNHREVNSSTLDETARMVLRAVTALAAVGSLCVTGWLLHRVLELEKALAAVEAKLVATTEQQRSVLEWLTQRVGNIASRPQSPRVTSRGIDARSSRDSDNESSCSRSDVGGYKTAEEEDEEGAEVAAAASKAAHRKVKVPTPAASSFKGTVAMPLVDEPSVPGRQADKEWAAQSVYIGDKNSSWSCLSEVASSSSSADLIKPTTGSSDAAAAAEAAEAHAAVAKAVLERADAMYEDGQYSDASELLSSQEASVEVLWRRCRLLKSFADIAKDKGDAKENERCLREAHKLVSEALQRDDTNWAVHKWFAITTSLVSAFGTRDPRDARSSEALQRGACAFAHPCSLSAPLPWAPLGSSGLLSPSCTACVRTPCAQMAPRPPSSSPLWSRSTSCALPSSTRAMRPRDMPSAAGTGKWPRSRGPRVRWRPPSSPRRRREPMTKRSLISPWLRASRLASTYATAS